MRASNATVRFDEGLRSRLPKNIRNNAALGRWMDSEELGDTEVAAQAIINMIRKLGQAKGNEILSRRGFWNLYHIIDSFSKFEGLIQHVHTKFRGKIYRDHLDHMLRTALIACQLGRNENISDGRMQEVILASLFHDAGYPLQEAGEILKSIEKNVRRSFKLLDFKTEILPNTTKKKLNEKIIKQLCQKTKITEKHLHAGLFEEPFHAIVGATVFLQCCKKITGRALRIASAICLHHSNQDTIVNDSENPLAVLLMIADELQDWGRPASYPRFRTGLHTFPMDKLKISRKYKYTLRYKGEKFPCFDVIYSKYTNLKRIHFEKLVSPIELFFPIDQEPFGSVKLSTMLQSFQESIKFEKYSTNPWKLGDGISLSDSQVARLSLMTRDRVIQVRKLLLAINPKDWDVPWYYRQYRSSSNFLITNQSFRGISVKRISNRFRIQLVDSKNQYTGEIVSLNNPPKIRIPTVVRVFPILYRLFSFVIETQNRGLSFDYSNMSAYWFRQ